MAPSDTVDQSNQPSMSTRQLARYESEMARKIKFRNAKEEVTNSRTGFLRVCDPFVRRINRQNYIKQGEQLICYKIIKGIAVGGQASTFTGRNEPKKVTNDGLMQQYICMEAHELAKKKGASLAELDVFSKKAEKKAFKIVEDGGRRKLRKALEELLVLQKDDENRQGLREPGNDVCIRVTNSLSDACADRLTREIAIIGMRHPNIVTTHNYGVICNRGVFVSELIKGVVEPYGFSLDQLIDGITDAAQGLKYMHDNGVFHRDVKPENIMFKRPNGTKVRAKMIDLGLIKILDFETKENRLTISGEILGTPVYACPEQSVSFKDMDAQSDIYSLGATMYELLTWEVPNPHDQNGGDAAAILECIKNLENKYFGRDSAKPTRPMNIDRKITLKELFDYQIIDGEKNKRNGRMFREIRRMDIEDDKIKLCNPLKKLYQRIIHQRQHHNLKTKLEYLETIIACAMHPGERDEADDDGKLLYTRKFRYQKMRHMISDLASVRTGGQPIKAFKIIASKYGNAKKDAKERYIAEVFSSKSRYAKVTLGERLSGAMSYTAKATAAVVAGAVGGSVIGHLLNTYLQVGDRVANLVGDIATKLPN